MKLMCLPTIITEVINDYSEMLTESQMKSILALMDMGWDIDKLTINELKDINEICDMYLGVE